MTENVSCDHGTPDLETGGNDCVDGKHAGENCSRGTCLLCKGLPMDIKPEAIPGTPRKPCDNCRGL